MNRKFFLPILAATFVFSSIIPVQANNPKPATAQKVQQNRPKKPVQPKWRLFFNRPGKFSVLMPGKPQQSSQVQKTHLGEINVNMFSASPPQQEVSYLVTYNDFPFSYGQPDNAQEIFNDAQNVALQTTRSRLVSQRNIDLNGRPGREIEYIDSSGKVTINRMYLVDERLYQVVVLTTRRQEKNLSRTMNAFLNSFQVGLSRNEPPKVPLDERGIPITGGRG